MEVLSQFNKNNGIKDYIKGELPVKLFYGSHDWAKNLIILETQNLLKLDKFETINKSNHFSFSEKRQLKYQSLLKVNILILKRSITMEKVAFITGANRRYRI